jgi:hypothetical protein
MIQRIRSLYSSQQDTKNLTVDDPWVKIRHHGGLWLKIRINIAELPLTLWTQLQNRQDSKG